MPRDITLSKDTLARLDTVLRAKAVLEGERLRRSLREYVKAAWAILEPGVTYKHNWHVDAICDHLEAAYRGEVLRLLINMPPRFAKSTIVSVLFPTWVWANTPGTKFLTASYAKDLATRDAVAARRLMESEWYKSRFGHKFQFTTDQNVKTRYINDKLGHRVVTSVDAAATGDGGDIQIIDDPINSLDANSEPKRKQAVTWLKETMSTRYNDPETGVQIMVMQRFAEDDPSGYVLSEGGYEHLCLPMRYEPKHAKTTSLGFKDPRTEDGQLLFPERFNEDAVRRLEKELGSYGTAGQLQQRPSVRGGGVLKSEWFGRYSTLPVEMISRKIYADTAQKTKEKDDFSVFECWGLASNGRIYLLDLIRGKWEAHELRRMAKDFWAKHAGPEPCPLSEMLVEDKVSGTGLIQELAHDGMIPIKGIQRTRDKLTRAYDAQPFLESGLVMVPDAAPFVMDFIDEVDKFTKDDSHLHDDQIDPMLDAIQDMLGSQNSINTWIRLGTM